MSEDFNYTSGGNYDALPSWWAVEFANGYFERTSAAGSLRIVSGAGYSEWWYFQDTAPKVLQPVDGDFEIEARVTATAAPHNYGAAQLFISQDSANWFGCGFLISASGIQYASLVTSSFDSVNLKAVSGGAPAKFKIRRTGNLVEGFYDVAGTWVALGSATIAWNPRFAGIYAKDTSYVGGYADFDYVAFSTTRTAPAGGIYQSKVFDLGVAPSAKGSISWVESVPAGASTSICARTSADGTTWSAWDGPYAASAGSVINAPLNRYLQFSATLMENGSLESPVIDKVTFTFPGIAPKAPVVTSTTHPAGTWGNGAAVELQWTEPADNPAPVWAYYYALDAPAISGTALAGTAVLISATNTGTTLNGLGDGFHEWQMVAQGQPAEYPLSPLASFLVRKDTMPPDPPTITSPTHPSIADSGNDCPVFDLAALDNVTLTMSISGIAGFHYVLDSTSGTIPTSGNDFTTGNSVSFIGLADGTYYFHARAKDAAGNLGTQAERPIKVSYRDRVKVLIASATHPENAESASNSPTFALSVSNPDGATLTGYSYVLDHTASTRPVASDAFTTAGTISFQGLANATWYLHVSAKNVTGTLTNPTHYMFVVNLKGEILDETRVHAVPHPITSKVATIRYDLLAPAQSIVAEVLDERGRKVAMLSASTSPGRNTMTWDTSGMANGIYFLRMKVRRQDGKENVVHKKLAVVR